MMTMVQAINAALADSMEADNRVVVFGEDVGKQGGVFRVTEGLQETFGRPLLRYPVGRVLHRGGGDRHGDSRLPAGARDPVRWLHVSGL